MFSCLTGNHWPHSHTNIQPAPTGFQVQRVVPVFCSERTVSTVPESSSFPSRREPQHYPVRMDLLIQPSILSPRKRQLPFLHALHHLQSLLCSVHYAKPGRHKGELDSSPSWKELTISERDRHMNTVQLHQRERDNAVKKLQEFSLWNRALPVRARSLGGRIF